MQEQPDLQNDKKEPVLHSEYLAHLRKYISHFNETSEFRSTLENYQKEINILSSLNFDPVIQILEETYSPKNRGKKRREPVCMLRSLFLMTLIREKSITKWVGKTRSFGYFFGILAGFNFNDTPGVGTYYDFFNRLIDSPFSPYTRGQTRRSQHNAKEFERNLGSESDAKKEDRNPNHTKSEKLANELLADASKPREPGFNTILEDMLFLLAIKPSIETGMITELDNIVVTGDGSIMQTASSRYGKTTCECRKKGDYKCGHSRIYSSRTAQICYDHHHNSFVFGDRYYHLIITQNGHDFPIHAHCRAVMKATIHCL
ncbi:Uncharacterized protein dnl_34180 [Desulfonema limicola]|uniref:Transposase InsH N-terminal domain-containing protein n=1 Tax=Desulfonema limicola TaxID=45656 RepID=A0A975B9E8_9BACT|nr:hypothetical protein [Desulfonema limicola]QTA81092.1 Uncharacterized protein dnl_34180 [Desulfonema limicola]